MASARPGPIVALIKMEFACVVDEELDIESAVIAGRKRLLDERAKELDHRERHFECREKQLGRRGRLTKVELERMAGEIQPKDPG